MNTRDLHTLDQNLLNSEFEIARAIYEHARSQGYAPLKAAALVYRHGILDGKESEKAKTKAVHKRFHEFVERTKSGESLPEAINEGSDDDE